MPTYFGPRNTASKLSKLVHKHVNRFATATLLTVVALALARAAEAKIVYKSAHVQIANLSSYTFDLNQDGVTDFTISISDSGGICGHQHVYLESAYEMPASGNGVVGAPPTWLNKGQEIGPSQTFYGGQGLLAQAPNCPGQQGNNGYLGLSSKLTTKPITGGWR
jgi:hypothetical protein